MAQDHNDIYSIVERLRILEEGLTPTTVKHGLNAQQKSVNQLSATFKPKTVAVLTAKQDPKNPLAGKLVGDGVENDKEPVEEAVATEDVLDKVKSSFVDYLKSIEDRYKDSNLKDKVKVDRDLGKKDPRDRDLVAKELDEDHRKLAVGDPITVTAPNEFEGKTGEISEFSPSGKFVVVNLYNHGEHSMHLSDVEYNEYADDDADEFGQPGSEFFNENPTTNDEIAAVPPVPVEDPVLPESAPVKTVTNECGLWEVHGDEPSGFEIRHGNRAMRSRFKTIDEAVMALEMFAARKKIQDESKDYIEEA
jgi:hypothetical protein